MSYDMWLEMDTGGADAAEVGGSICHTSDASGIWEAAMGQRLLELDGMVASEAILLLEGALSYTRDPDNWKSLLTLESADGEVTVERAANFLKAMLLLCTMHPKATICISG